MPRDARFFENTVTQAFAHEMVVGGFFKKGEGRRGLGDFRYAKMMAQGPLRFSSIDNSILKLLKS